jgi:ribonucleoside-diphosphate reductase beta chain
LFLAEPVHSVHTHFDAIQRDRQETDTPESVRNYAKQQFEKRLNRIAKARGQSVEQIEEIVLSEDSAETAAP